MTPVSGRIGPITVAVLTNDPFMATGVHRQLTGVPGVELLDQGRLPDADVLVVCALDLDDSLLSRLTAATTTPRDPRQAAILISDEPEGRAMVEAHFDGIVGFVRRTEASQEVITAAVVAGATREIRDDDDRLRRSEYRRRPIAQRRGDHRDELTGREIDVVALLADGLSTIEVAQRLGWSDRTVKKVIHGLLIRKGLRNRVHAVAYASRTGAI